MLKQAKSGFTLAELLIALAILGVIATFTIPKVLTTAGDGQNTAIFKEAASMISGAQQGVQQQSGITVTTATHDFTPFMNYVNRTTDGTAIDNATTDIACTAAIPCINLHNGGVIGYTNAQAYTAGTTGTHYITFYVDPDGTGTTSQEPTAVVVYGNGRLTSGSFATGTVGSAGLAIVADPAYAAW